jgi:hypothetical protein
MKRRLLNLLAALSLAAFLATAWLWSDSPWGFSQSDERSFAAGTARYFIASRSGGLRLMRQRIADRSGSPLITADADRLGCWHIKWGFGTVGTGRFGPAEPRRLVAGFGRDAQEYYRRTDGYAPGPGPFPQAHPGTVAGYHAASFVLEYRVWAVPYWPFLGAFGVLPLLRLRAWHLRRLRSSAGLCPACGYDLTFNVSGVCPECGTAPAPPAVQGEGGHDPLDSG